MDGPSDACTRESSGGSPSLHDVELSEAARRAVADLGRRYGEPLGIEAPIDDGFDDPIRRADRFGEVLMAIRRPSGKLLLSIKTFYPRGAYRLPTGGIHHGEPVLDALVRETREETGLDTEVRRFLATIAYRPRSAANGPPIFHTFAFLVDELGGTLGTLDPGERIESWSEVWPDDLPAVAERLERVASKRSDEIGGDWAHWGRFRAVAHRVVHRALLAQR